MGLVPIRLSVAGLVGLLGLFVVSCSGPTGAGDGSAVTVTYEDIAPAGYIDQTVTLDYSGPGLVVPTVEYVPLDGNGEPVEGVTVTAAFGSDSGGLVISPPGGFDVLAFRGERVGEVVAVDAVVVSTDRQEGEPIVVAADPVPLFGDQVVTKFEPFSAMEVENTNDRTVAMRAVCLVYDLPAPGEAQQADEISVLIERFEVGSNSTMVVPIDGGFAVKAEERSFGCDSLKVHLTP